MRYRTTLLAALLLSLLGCKKLVTIAAKSQDAGHPTSASSPAESASAQTSSKESPKDKHEAEDDNETLNGLVECLNGLDTSINRSLDRYTSWLPKAKPGTQQPGATGKERVVYTLDEVRDFTVKDCKEGLRLASTNPTFKETAAKYEAVTDKIVPVINGAHTYYNREDYKDDKFAKGKQLHATLWPLAEEFFNVSKELRALVVKANDARMDADLKKVEATQGRSLVFQKLNVLKHAKAAVAVGSDEKGAVAELQPLMEAYAKAFEEMKTYAASHKAETDKVIMWSSFESKAEDYLKALKERVRRLRDRKPYDTGESALLRAGSGEMVEGTPMKVNHAYNDLVERANSAH